jgi:hypothetical protein
MTKPLWVLPVDDNDASHRVELTKVVKGRGVGTMLDHDTEQVDAFVSFGAEGPACYEVLQAWRQSPIDCLLRYGSFDDDEMGLQCFDWVDTVTHYLDPLPKEMRQVICDALDYQRGLTEGTITINKELLDSLSAIFDDLTPLRDGLFYGFEATSSWREIGASNNEAIRASSVVTAIMSLAIVLRDVFIISSLRQQLMDFTLSDSQEEKLSARLEKTQEHFRFGVRNVAHETVQADVPYFVDDDDEEEREDDFEKPAELKSPLRQRQIKDVLKLMQSHKELQESFAADILSYLERKKG